MGSANDDNEHRVGYRSAIVVPRDAYETQLGRSGHTRVLVKRTNSDDRTGCVRGAYEKNERPRCNRYPVTCAWNIGFACLRITVADNERVSLVKTCEGEKKKKTQICWTRSGRTNRTRGIRTSFRGTTVSFVRALSAAIVIGSTVSVELHRFRIRERRVAGARHLLE